MTPAARTVLECLALGPEATRTLRASVVGELHRLGLVDIRMEPNAAGRREAQAFITRAGAAAIERKAA